MAGDVFGGFEHAECASALGVWLALGNLFAVEMRHLLEEMHIVQHDRPVGADRQRIAVTGCARACRGGRAEDRLLL